MKAPYWVMTQESTSPRIKHLRAETFDETVYERAACQLNGMNLDSQAGELSSEAASNK